jgi:hypothetical protein
MSHPLDDVAQEAIPGPLAIPLSPLQESVVSKSSFRLWLIALMLLALADAKVMAWNETGHRLIAVAAYELLSPDMRNKVADILRRHERFGADFEKHMPPEIAKLDEKQQVRWLFSQAAWWPDLVRSFRDADKEKYHRGTWHYVNRPLFLNESQRERLESKLTANVGTEIPEGFDEKTYNIIQALRNSSAKLKSRSTPVTEKALHVCWLFHLVGDSHQPMHAAALFSENRFPEGDFGGNKIPLAIKKNLHALWDDLLGEKKTLGEITGRWVRWREDTELIKLGQRAAAEMDFVKWIDESQELAKRVSYHKYILAEVAAKEGTDEPLAPIDLPKSYFKEGGQVAQGRAIEAAFRLAKLMEMCLAE